MQAPDFLKKALQLFLFVIHFFISFRRAGCWPVFLRYYTKRVDSACPFLLFFVDLWKKKDEKKRQRIESAGVCLTVGFISINNHLRLYSEREREKKKRLLIFLLWKSFVLRVSRGRTHAERCERQTTVFRTVKWPLAREKCKATRQSSSSNSC